MTFDGFSYNAVTGQILKDGEPRGWSLRNGYISIYVRGRFYLAHRLAWFLTYGEWPPADVDHIDGNRANNALSNLRLATRSQNNGNSKRSKANTTGFKGVSFHRQTGKFRASIGQRGKYIHLGLFASAEEAHAAYCQAAKQQFGQYARAA